MDSTTCSAKVKTNMLTSVEVYILLCGNHITTIRIVRKNIVCIHSCSVSARSEINLKTVRSLSKASLQRDSDCSLYGTYFKALGFWWTAILQSSSVRSFAGIDLSNKPLLLSDSFVFVILAHPRKTLTIRGNILSRNWMKIIILLALSIKLYHGIWPFGRQFISALPDVSAVVTSFVFHSSSRRTSWAPKLLPYLKLVPYWWN